MTTLRFFHRLHRLNARSGHHQSYRLLWREARLCARVRRGMA